MSRVYPTTADGLTPALLNSIMSEQYPNVVIGDVKIVESKVYGDGMVSTAGRVIVDLNYAVRSPENLPERIVVKIARSKKRFLQSLYSNEVAIYKRLRPYDFLEVPRAYGGAYDDKSGTFLLLLEDLRDRNAIFSNVTVPINLAQMHSLLNVTASLHARYWNNSKLTTEVGWMETHQSGEVHDFCNDMSGLPGLIASEVEHEQFKREMVQRLRSTVSELHAGYQAVQRHQASLPQTVLHGDAHIGNTYLLPGDKGGLIDWQLSVRGYCMHDVSYLLATGLTVEMRRQYERDLLLYYRDRLLASGVQAPSFDELWVEYRRAAVWGVYIGWLTTRTTNYGWEICVLNHIRVMTAFEDLETLKLLKELL